MAKSQNVGEWGHSCWGTPELVDPRGFTASPEELQAADEVLRGMSEPKLPLLKRVIGIVRPS